uniref:Uncharacterized protein n=1 Tax=Fagus sylvatica TaxID=28930 RepID=A0A2N9IEK0_FAGSY
MTVFQRPRCFGGRESKKSSTRVSAHRHMGERTPKHEKLTPFRAGISARKSSGSGNQLLDTAKTQTRKRVMVAVEINGGDQRDVWRYGGADRRDVWRGGDGDRCVCGRVAVLRRGGVAVLRRGGVAVLRGEGERNERERE